MEGEWEKVVGEMEGREGEREGGEEVEGGRGWCGERLRERGGRE